MAHFLLFYFITVTKLLSSKALVTRQFHDVCCLIACNNWCVTLIVDKQEYCLKFIIKESNYNQIVMSREFETIEQPQMVEIIRRHQMPHRRPLSEPLAQFDVLNCESVQLCTLQTHSPIAEHIMLQFTVTFKQESAT